MSRAGLSTEQTLMHSITHCISALLGHFSPQLLRNHLSQTHTPGIRLKSLQPIPGEDGCSSRTAQPSLGLLFSAKAQLGGKAKGFPFPLSPYPLVHTQIMDLHSSGTRGDSSSSCQVTLQCQGTQSSSVPQASPPKERWISLGPSQYFS